MTSKSPPPGPAGAAQRLVRQTAQLGAVLDEAADKAAAQAGLTRADVDVVQALHRARGGRLTPSEVAAACGLSSGGTSNIVRRLATSGYLTREANESDGRSSWVQLTEEGAALAGSIGASVDDGHARLLRRLPDGLADELLDALERTLEHLGR
ncbi:MarR family winged helix-turn-helix transcriptional regulator [Streptomyces sp. NPDC050504]|uniref:MarR family winged helix-turn-helix transcriptional regulator n=1 Tax=Streptomyces sp. NPDC050504 TaxID=3365618 RepID=UPI003793A76C